jgi:hypothetical protein
MTEQGKGKIPRRVGEMRLGFGASIRLGLGWCKGNLVAAESPLEDSLKEVTWPATTGCLSPIRVTSKGKRGIFPSEPPHRMGWLGRGARRARQLAPGRPIAHARGGQRDATGCRGEKGEE